MKKKWILLAEGLLLAVLFVLSFGGSDIVFEADHQQLYRVEETGGIVSKDFALNPGVYRIIVESDIANGGIGSGMEISLEAGEKILEDQDADIVAYGRSMLADPDIANKAASGECIRECLNCNKGCVDAIQGRRYISCVLNAENGNEGTVFIKPAEKIKNIAGYTPGSEGVG